MAGFAKKSCKKPPASGLNFCTPGFLKQLPSFYGSKMQKISLVSKHEQEQDWEQG